MHDKLFFGESESLDSLLSLEEIACAYKFHQRPRMDFQFSTVLSFCFFSWFCFPYFLPTLADLHPLSNTLVRFSTLSQMFYSRFYNALPMPTAHSVTIRDPSIVFPPCCSCTMHDYAFDIHFSCWFLYLPVPPCVLYSQHVTITALVSPFMCKKTRSHAKACLSTKIYIRFLKNRS